MKKNKDFFIVGIGASAGGLEVIQSFFKHITKGSQAAFVLIQHLPPDFKSLMSELLAKYTDLPIVKIEEPTPVEPGYVYLMSAQKNVIIENRVLKPVDHDEKSIVNLPIDLFFHSLGNDQRGCSMGVVLTGTGTDGSRGIKTIHEHGGIVMVQDPDDAKFDGMPRAALLSGVVDYSLDIEQVSAEVNRIVDNDNAPQLPQSVRKLPNNKKDYLKEVMSLVFEETQIDFSLYRPETILRRLTKRLFVVRIRLIKDYYEYVKKNPSEAHALALEFLIGVSQFFRDPEIWKDVAEKVIPPLVSQKQNHDVIRVWVAACSTGEEAYTLGMLLSEAIRLAKQPLSLKIFATDVNPNAIAFSSAGYYSENIESTVPEQLLTRYFERTSNGYRVRKNLRDCFVFAVHNFLSDPPFIDTDLISCRNALIYIRPTIQQKVIESFRFSLKREGFLLLGKSEGLGALKPAFDTVVSRHKIFRASPHHQYSRRRTLLDAHRAMPRRIEKSPPNATISATVDAPVIAPTDIYTELLAEKYAPDGIFVNAALDVLYINGEANRYLKLPRGEIRLNLNTMLEAEQICQLQTGVRQVLKNNTTLVYEKVLFNEREQVDITFTPFQSANVSEAIVLITFSSPHVIISSPDSVEKIASDTQLKEQVRQLQGELRAKDDALRELQEKLETNYEELQASNEELIASNEELQNSNEELQSMNEELYTVSTELQEKIEELVMTNSDIDNLLNSTQIATLFLDDALRVRMFTPALGEIIPVTDQDVGRAIDHFSINLLDTKLVEEAQQVLIQGKPVEKEVMTRDQKKRFLLRVFPYQKGVSTADGLVVTFVDLTEIKQARQAFLNAKNYAENIVSSVKDPLVVLDQSLIVLSANPAFYRMFSATPEQVVNHRIYELGEELWRVDTLQSLLEEIIPQNTIVNDYVIRQEFPDHGQRVIELDAVQILQGSNQPALILLSLRDITEKVEAQEQILVTTQRLKMVLESSKTGIWEWDLTKHTVEADEQWHIIFDIPQPSPVDVQQVRDRVHPDDYDRVTHAIEQAQDNNQFYDEDFRIINSQGKILHINGQGSVVRDKQGMPIKMIGINVDITEKKQSEKQLRLSEERFTMAASGTSDGVYDYYNMETGESWWSPRLYELLGYTPNELVANAQHFRRRVHPKDQGLTQKAIREYLDTGQPFDIEFRVKHKTLGYRWFRSRANIVLDDQQEVIRMVGAFADIHQRKISELNLQQANRKLRIANEYLDNFVFMAAHDLRSPVANLKSLTDLWRTGHDNHDFIVDKVEKSVGRLDDTLSGLIQILDIQQYEHEQVGEVAFEHICQKLLTEMAEVIDSEQIKIHTDFSERSIHYIEPFLESTIRNLLSNAINYRSPKRPAEITLSTRHENGFVLFEVQDNGIGIDLKRGRNKLFKAFERLTQEGEGMGIGMHLVKNMVEKNEGFIEVESEVDQGTTIKVYLKPYG